MVSVDADDQVLMSVVTIITCFTILISASLKTIRFDSVQKKNNLIT